jgi:NADH dehydrogenase [ubiquinone] 1 alpha subcomplex assembly factor 5
LAASQIYQQIYPGVDDNNEAKGITATFQVIYMIGWKPGASSNQTVKVCAN